MKKLIVRRGLGESYYAFLRVFAASRRLDVTVDRRQSERRHLREQPPTDRRSGDRRGPLPGTWDLADFVAIDEPDLPSE
jgi:hypothetical protein